MSGSHSGSSSIFDCFGWWRRRGYSHINDSDSDSDSNSQFSTFEEVKALIEPVLSAAFQAEKYTKLQLDFVTNILDSAKKQLSKDALNSLGVYLANAAAAHPGAQEISLQETVSFNSLSK